MNDTHIVTLSVDKYHEKHYIDGIMQTTFALLVTNISYSVPYYFEKPVPVVPGTFAVLFQ